MPKVSIVIPFHWMKNWQFFLNRCLESIEKQTYKDYEIILMKVGSMPETSNRVIQAAKGEYIKVLYMDDYFFDEVTLWGMMKNIEIRNINASPVEWVICAANDNLEPEWTDNLETGNNKLGSPSALIFRNHFEDNILFDEKLSWLLDCDLYKRLNEKYGKPLILPGYKGYIGIGKHDGQMTNLMSDDYKLSEHKYVQEKYEKSIANRS